MLPFSHDCTILSVGGLTPDYVQVGLHRAEGEKGGAVDQLDALTKENAGILAKVKQLEVHCCPLVDNLSLIKQGMPNQ